MKKQISRISILQSSKIVTAMYVFFGLIYSIIGVLMIALGPESLRMMGIIYLFMPIIMAVIGFIFFVLSAALYNLFAKWLGGMEMEFRDIEPSA